MTQDTIRVDYHVPRDSLTHSYRIYCKDGHSHVVEMDARAPPLNHIAQLEQFKALLQAEKDCTMVRVPPSRECVCVVVCLSGARSPLLTSARSPAERAPERVGGA